MSQLSVEWTAGANVAVLLCLLGFIPMAQHLSQSLTNNYYADLSLVRYCSGLCRALFTPCIMCVPSSLFKNGFCTLSLFCISLQWEVAWQCEAYHGRDRIWSHLRNTFSDPMSKLYYGNVWCKCAVNNKGSRPGTPSYRSIWVQSLHPKFNSVYLAVSYQRGETCWHGNTLKVN